MLFGGKLYGFGCKVEVGVLVIFVEDDNKEFYFLLLILLGLDSVVNLLKSVVNLG